MAAKLPALGESGQRKLEAGDTQGALQDFQQATEWAEQLSKAYPEEPAYAQNLFFYLDRTAATFAAAGQLQDAVNIQKPVADGYRDMAAVDGSDEAKSKAAIALEHLAWYQILTRDHAAALETARQAVALDPNDASIKAKLAHGLLLNGKKDEAKAIYAAERRTVLPDGRTFEQGVLAEFAAMEKAGVTDAGIADIRVLYGAKQPGSMPMWLAVLVLIAIFGFIIGIIAFFFMVERKRRQQLDALTKARGWTYRNKPTGDDNQLLSGTMLGTYGETQHLTNIIELPESDGARITLFDFDYTSGDDERSRTIYQTVARIQSPQLRLPSFVLRPESFLSKAAKLVGYDDINFAEHPEFSRRYLLSGQDQAAVRRVFTPAVIQFCEAHPKLVIEANGDRMVVYRQGVRVKTNALDPFIEEARSLARLFSEASGGPR